DQGRDKREGPFPSSPVQSALAPDVLELAPQLRHARADPAPVDFELRFAGTARADPAAQPRKRLAQAAQPWKAIAQLGQLDLNLALPRAGSLSEDVEDELCPVDDPHLEGALDIARLGRRELVVEDDKVDMERFAQSDQLV